MYLCIRLGVDHLSPSVNLGLYLLLYPSTSKSAWHIVSTPWVLLRRHTELASMS